MYDLDKWQQTDKCKSVTRGTWDVDLSYGGRGPATRGLKRDSNHGPRVQHRYTCGWD